MKEPPQHRSTGGQNGYNQHRERQRHLRFVVNEKGTPPGKLADGELHFNNGVLAGLPPSPGGNAAGLWRGLAEALAEAEKLIGFSVWERRSGVGRNVTFPARQYSVNGERRSFALLRPTDDVVAQERVRDIILEAYAQLEADGSEA